MAFIILSFFCFFTAGSFVLAVQLLLDLYKPATTWGQIVVSLKRLVICIACYFATVGAFFVFGAINYISSKGG